MTEIYYVGLIGRGVYAKEEWLNNYPKFQEQVMCIPELEKISYCIYMGTVQYFRLLLAKSSNAELQNYIHKLYGYTLKNGYATEYRGTSTESISDEYFNLFLKNIQRVTKDVSKLNRLYNEFKSWELLDRQHIKMIQFSSGRYRFDEWLDINRGIEAKIFPYLNQVRMYVETQKADACIDLLNYAAYVGKLKVCLINQHKKEG